MHGFLQAMRPWERATLTAVGNEQLSATYQQHDVRTGAPSGDLIYITGLVNLETLLPQLSGATYVLLVIREGTLANGKYEAPDLARVCNKRTGEHWEDREMSRSSLVGMCSRYGLHLVFEVPADKALP